ncbi:MAG: nucleotidyltransferase domain-containing protein [Thermoanaerobaculia bacterium]
MESPGELTLEAILAGAEAIGRQDRRIVALDLFGSRASGEAHPGSDVDLGALFREPVPLAELLELEERLGKALSVPVDLVDAGRASAFLALDIVRGERLYCADEDKADEFDLYVLRRAGDLEPFERERRRVLLTP